MIKPEKMRARSGKKQEVRKNVKNYWKVAR